MARDFDCQVAELQVRIAVLKVYTALGIPVTEAVEYVRRERGSPAIRQFVQLILGTVSAPCERRVRSDFTIHHARIGQQHLIIQLRS